MKTRYLSLPTGRVILLLLAANNRPAVGGLLGQLAGVVVVVAVVAGHVRHVAGLGHVRHGRGRGGHGRK